jgi:threonine dehydratase
MPPFTLDELESTIGTVRAFVPPTPAYAWSLLARTSGAEVIVKHENHTPTGSFKARGVLVYVDALRRASRLPTGLVTATRGNHGQSVAIAGARNGIPSIIVVPEGNSREKNAAMEALGGQLVTAGKDFDESRAIAAEIQHERGYHFVPSFHRDLVKGVATCAHELFTGYPGLDVVYVPIGMGSGICGLITVRDLFQLKTEIVGVVAEGARRRLVVRSGSPDKNQCGPDVCRWAGVPRPAARRVRDHRRRSRAHCSRLRGRNRGGHPHLLHHDPQYGRGCRGGPACGALEGKGPLRREARGPNPVGRQH